MSNKLPRALQKEMNKNRLKSTQKAKVVKEKKINVKKVKSETIQLPAVQPKPKNIKSDSSDAMGGLKLDEGFYGSPRWTYEILDCAMPMTFDTYSNCAHQCLYCFSFFQR